MDELKLQALAFDHEKRGNVEEAIEIYWRLINSGFDGSNPYERLRILYAKQENWIGAIKACQAYIDLEKTYTNALTAISPEKAAIPMHFETDRQCIEACLHTIGMVKPQAARIIQIKNTATLDNLRVSRVLEGEIAASPELQLIGPWEPMGFDKQGNLK